jgi:hypothetical protein
LPAVRLGFCHHDSVMCTHFCGNGWCHGRGNLRPTLLLLMVALASTFAVFAVGMSRDGGHHRRLATGAVFRAAAADSGHVRSLTVAEQLQAPLELGPLACLTARQGPVNPPLVLAYESSGLQDGAGAQLQRILTLYQASFALGVGYAHTPLRDVGYQGVQALEKNTGDAALVQSWRDAFTLPSHHTNGCGADPGGRENSVGANCTHVRMFMPTFIDAKQAAETACGHWRATGETTVLRIVLAHKVLDPAPYLVRHPRAAFGGVLQWLSTHPAARRPASASRDGAHVNAAAVPVGGAASTHRVAVHVRRGELFVVDTDRMLPNSYYIEVCNMLSRIFTELGARDWLFEIYTEQVARETVVTPAHHGISHRRGDNVTLRPEDTHLEDFNALKPRVKMMVNGDPVDTLQRLATADVLVTSRSSFSWVASMLHDPGHGLVIMHPFWHCPRPDWYFMIRDAPVEDNAATLKSIITERLQNNWLPPRLPWQLYDNGGNVC